MKHILVIDDDPVVLVMARDFLEDAGYRVSVANDAIYSNDVIYGSDPPDLILMDVMMPLMSGDKKVRALKRRDRSSNIPVLLISGDENEEARERAGLLDLGERRIDEHADAPQAPRVAERIEQRASLRGCDEALAARPEVEADRVDPLVDAGAQILGPRDPADLEPADLEPADLEPDGPHALRPPSARRSWPPGRRRA